MTYYTMTSEASDAWVALKRDGGPVSLDNYATRVESDDVVLEVVGEVAGELRLWKEAHGPGGTATFNEFEAFGAAECHQRMRDFPSEVLLNPSFWRWVAADPFFDLVEWRFGVEGSMNNYGSRTSSFRRCLPYKMFLRGKIGFVPDADDPYALVLVGGEDFWASHLIAVRNGAVPVIAHAFIKEYASRVDDATQKTPNTDQVREFARRMNRLRSNILTEVLTESDAHLRAKQQMDAVLDR